MIGFGDSSRLPRGGRLDRALGRGQPACSTHSALSVRLSWGTTRAVRRDRDGRVAAGAGGRAPSRVLRCTPSRSVLSMHTAQVDDAGAKLDGSHLVELWGLRAGFYPEDVELLERFMIDCLRAGDLAAEGHRVVARYAVEERLPLVACPVLLIAPTGGPRTRSRPYPARRRAAARHGDGDRGWNGAAARPAAGQFADAVETFLDELGASPSSSGSLDHAARTLDRGARSASPSPDSHRAARTAARSPRSRRSHDVPRSSRLLRRRRYE